MKVELMVKAGWAETRVELTGDKLQVEKIVEAIKKAFEDDNFVEIK